MLLQKNFGNNFSVYARTDSMEVSIYFFYIFTVHISLLSNRNIDL